MPRSLAGQVLSHYPELWRVVTDDNLLIAHTTRPIVRFMRYATGCKTHPINTMTKSRIIDCLLLLSKSHQGIIPLLTFLNAVFPRQSRLWASISLSLPAVERLQTLLNIPFMTIHPQHSTSKTYNVRLYDLIQHIRTQCHQSEARPTDLQTRRRFLSHLHKKDLGILLFLLQKKYKT